MSDCTKEQVNESLCLSVALHLVSVCFDSLLPFCLSPLLQWGWEGYFPGQTPKELLVESGEQGRTAHLQRGQATPMEPRQSH